MPCILNAANEIAVSAFLKERIGFLQMPDVVEHTMETCTFVPSPDLESLENSDHDARMIAKDFINKLLN